MELIKLSDFLWEIPKHGAMRVPGRIYASSHMMDELRDHPALVYTSRLNREFKMEIPG
jgi:hypothetical protein